MRSAMGRNRRWISAPPITMTCGALASFSASSIVATGSAPSSCQSGSRVRTMRSEEHTSELQSLMRISYAVFCLKKKKKTKDIKEQAYHMHKHIHALILEA